MRSGTVLLVLSLSVACRVPQSGAAGAASPSPAPVEVRHASPDVRFLHDMIFHHLQALSMTSFVPSRTNRDDIRLIAERISRSQKDEMAAMDRWLSRKGEKNPSSGALHEHALMPGMLTYAELQQLEKASGPAFDRLFLEKMIKHHEGALTMVKALFGSPGAAQDAELYQIAADVDADQRAEINRMRTLLRSLP